MTHMRNDTVKQSVSNLHPEDFHSTLHSLLKVAHPVWCIISPNPHMSLQIVKITRGFDYQFKWHRCFRVLHFHIREALLWTRSTSSLRSLDRHSCFLSNSFKFSFILPFVREFAQMFGHNWTNTTSYYITTISPIYIPKGITFIPPIAENTCMANKPLRTSPMDNPSNSNLSL